MGTIIHSRNTTEGIRFRMWSENSDKYISEEMTEADVREWTLKEAVNIAIEIHLREVDTRIKRTREHGTSSMISDGRDLNGPWDKRRRH